MIKRLLQCIGLLAMMLCLMGMRSDIHLVVSYQTDIPMQDVELRLYRVGDVVDDKIVLSDEYSKYDLAVDDSSLLTLPSTLQSYIRRDEIEAVHVALTNEYGKIEVSNLTSGLYLVDGSDVLAEEGLYRIVPSLVYINSENCEIELKHEFVPKEPETLSKIVRKVWSQTVLSYADKYVTDVTVDLLSNGEVYDTFVLNAENNWTKVFEGLDKSVLWSFVEHTELLPILPDGWSWLTRVSVDGDMTEILNGLEVPVAVTPSPVPTVVPSVEPSVMPPPVGIVTEEPKPSERPVVSNEPDPVEPESPDEVVNTPNTGVENSSVILVLVLCGGVLCSVGAALGIKYLNKKNHGGLL